jgi:hypothetical protein
MDGHDARRTGRRFATPHPGDEVDLWLRPELSSELPLPTAAARLNELRASGVDRLRVRVARVPHGDVLSAEDAVKVEAPELIGDPGDSGVYVRLEFLDLPTIPADSDGHDGQPPSALRGKGRRAFRDAPGGLPHLRRVQ